MTEWRQRNPERAAAQRLTERCRKYGITVEEFRALGDACVLCGSDKLLAIDHDHETGKVRGLLCRYCNGTLGCVDSAWLTRAKEYIDGSR